jgi:hypothetical protein
MIKMQAGIFAEVSGEIDSLDSFHESYTQDGRTFNRSFQVQRRSHLDSGETLYEGEAAIEIIEEQDAISIDEETGNISVTAVPERTEKYTQFLVLSDTIMTVGSSAGEFAFDLLRSQVPGVGVQRVEIDLNSYADEYYTADEVDPWQVGFYGNVGQAEKGVVYGEDVFDDSEIGDVLERSMLNQLGLEYEVENERFKITTSRSGYVEIYNPSNIKSVGFIDFIVKELLEYFETPE